MGARFLAGRTKENPFSLCWGLVTPREPVDQEATSGKEQARSHLSVATTSGPQKQAAWC